MVAMMVTMVLLLGNSIAGLGGFAEVKELRLMEVK